MLGYSFSAVTNLWGIYLLIMQLVSSSPLLTPGPNPYCACSNLKWSNWGTLIKQLKLLIFEMLKHHYVVLLLRWNHGRSSEVNGMILTSSFVSSWQNLTSTSTKTQFWKGHGGRVIASLTKKCCICNNNHLKVWRKCGYAWCRSNVKVEVTL